MPRIGTVIYQGRITAVYRNNHNGPFVRVAGASHYLTNAEMATFARFDPDYNPQPPRVIREAPRVELQLANQAHNAHFGRSEFVYQIDDTNAQGGATVGDVVLAFRELLRSAELDQTPNNFIYFYITSESGNLRSGVLSRQLATNEMTYAQVRALIEKLFEYENGVLGNNTLVRAVYNIVPPDDDVGGGRGPHIYSDEREAVRRTNALKLVPHDIDIHPYCFYGALIYHKQHVEKKDYTPKAQLTRAAKRLAEDLDVRVPTDGVGPFELQQLAEKLRIHIAVIKWCGNERDRIQFKCSNVYRFADWKEHKDGHKGMCVLLTSWNHYHLVKQPHLLLGGKAFCYLCVHTTNRPDGYHACKAYTQVENSVKLVWCVQCMKYGYPSHDCIKAAEAAK